MRRRHRTRLKSRISGMGQHPGWSAIFIPRSKPHDPSKDRLHPGPYDADSCGVWPRLWPGLSADISKLLHGFAIFGNPEASPQQEQQHITTRKRSTGSQSLNPRSMISIL